MLRNVLIFLGLGVATGSTVSWASGTAATIKSFWGGDCNSGQAGSFNPFQAGIIGTIDLTVGTCSAKGSEVFFMDSDTSGPDTDFIGVYADMAFRPWHTAFVCFGATQEDCQQNLDTNLQSGETINQETPNWTIWGVLGPAATGGCYPIWNAYCSDYGFGEHCGGVCHSHSLTGEIIEEPEEEKADALPIILGGVMGSLSLLCTGLWLSNAFGKTCPSPLSKQKATTEQSPDQDL
ncbi:hypothetical protein TrST_g734 [Triparma strigata]|uniref:Uncharacterized protein n=1 Tax=Triparma strigata TaxID=1606541 RepID=A0A9W7E8E4_9STRA|nr:hypothetical protein TrST_g734 [Triparma strigata]